MDKAVYDQITNLIEKSQKILLLTHAKADCDGLGAALSSYLVLKELGKEVTIVTNDPAPESLGFLPSIDILQNSIGGSADFIISVDTAKIPVGKIKYNVEDQKINIIITPKSGSFSENDVSFAQGEAKFDLIIILDTGNLEHLGPLYDKNVEMFFDTPIVNIDHHSSNTDFGQVNLVNMTASSTTEILYEYLVYLEKKYDKKLVTDDVATLLLAGIITDTGSFQHANTSPRSMETASRLLDLGARQQEIIKNIYKTKKLSTLKLWGIILSKVQVDPVHRMVWSTISKEDFQEADADPDETEGIIDDLLTNAPGAEVIFLIKYNPEYVSVSMRSTGSAIDVGKFCAENGGGGHARAAGFKVRDGRPFDQVASEAIRKVRQFQAKRLNIHPEDTAKPMGAPMGDPIGGPIVDKVTQKQPEPTVPTPTVKPEKPKETTYLDFKAPAPAKPKPPESGLGEVAVSPNSPQPPKPKKRKRRRRPKKKSAFTAPPAGAVAESADVRSERGRMGYPRPEEKPIAPTPPATPKPPMPETPPPQPPVTPPQPEPPMPPPPIEPV